MKHLQGDQIILETLKVMKQYTFEKWQVLAACYEEIVLLLFLNLSFSIFVNELIE